MGMIHALSESGASVIRKLQAGQIAGLVHVHQPVDADGRVSKWPDGVKLATPCAGRNCGGWFEEDMLLTWGAGDDYVQICELLENAGVDVHYIG